MSQNLHEALTTEQINGLLSEGALLVWIARHQTDLTVNLTTNPPKTPEQRWDVVLDHPDYPEETGIIQAWLDSISPGVVDEAMLRGSRLSQSPGTTALNALKQLAAGDGS